MSARISLKNFDVFQQRCKDLEDVGAEIKKSLGVYVPRAADDIWNDRVSQKYTATRLERAALAGTKVRASAASVTMQGATKPRVPGIWPQVDFGVKDKSARTTYSRKNRNGGSHKVTRRTRNQLPDYRKRGVMYRSMKESETRFKKLIAQTIVRTLYDLIEGR